MADSIVLQCVLEHNRPLNVQCVADLLATKGVKKVQVQRSLDELAAAGKLRSKEFGKVKIYYPNQNTAILDKEEIAASRARLAELTDQVAQSTKLLASKQQELASLKNVMTVEELQSKLAKLSKQVATLEAKVAPLREGQQTISKEESIALEKAFNDNMQAWQSRKRMFLGIWGDISEGIDRKQADVFEEIGVDTDEAMGVSYKDFANLISKRRR